MITRITKAEYNRLVEQRQMNPEWATGLYFVAPDNLCYKTSERGAIGANEMRKFIKKIKDQQKSQLDLFDQPESDIN